MPVPQKPTGAFVQNGWWLELPGLVSPRFETLSGLSRKTGVVTTVDAGTNITYKFSAQIQDFGQIQLSRNPDGTVDDKGVDLLVNLSLTAGQKFAGRLVKRHFGSVVFQIGFDGLNFIEDNYSDFAVASEEKLMQNFTATVDSWFKI